MRELSVSEIEEVNGGGECEAYAEVTETFFTVAGGIIGSAFGGIGGIAGVGLGGLLGKWAGSEVLKDCA